MKIMQKILHLPMMKMWSKMLIFYEQGLNDYKREVKRYMDVAGEGLEIEDDDNYNDQVYEG